MRRRGGRELRRVSASMCLVNLSVRACASQCTPASFDCFSSSGIVKVGAVTSRATGAAGVALVVRSSSDSVHFTHPSGAVLSNIFRTT